MTYRPDIDGLRALAILLVTVFHFDLLSVGKAGFIGVDVFFVISGYLITSIIARELAAGEFRFGVFITRRIRRLYPAILATLTLFLIVGSQLLLPNAFLELAREALLSLLYVVNFYFWREVSYFGLQADTIPLLHMWSLAVEEQFYVLFPLFCLAIWRWKPTMLLPAVILAMVLSFLLGLMATPVKPSAAFYLLPTRAWELLAGCTLALVLRSRTTPLPFSSLIGGTGLFLIFLAFYLHTPAHLVPGWFALLPVGGAVLLLLSGLDPQSVTSRLLSLRPVVWVGLISYPLYLVHWPVMYLFKTSMQFFDLQWRFIGFGVSIFLAWLIYRFVEQPVRKGRVLNTPGVILGGAGGMSAVLLAASLVIIWQQGIPQRFAPEVSEILAYEHDTAEAFRSCDGYLPTTTAEACRLGDATAEVDMLVFGDSHANAFARSIDLWLKRQGRAASFTFSHSCLPVSNLGDTECTAQFDKALRFAQAHAQINTVMMVSIWRQPYEGGLAHKGVWNPRPQIEAAFVEELSQSVKAFDAVGKDVVLVEPFYAAPGHVPQTLANNIAYGRDWPIDTPLSTHQSTFAALYAAFAEAEKAGARRISLIDPFCATGTCLGLFEGRPIFSDNNHLADNMSKPLSKLFESALP